MTESETDSEILIQFGKSLRIRRGSLNLSQEQLSKICGLDRTYIGGVERGKRNIRLVNIKKIADALNISITELFYGL